MPETIAFFSAIMYDENKTNVPDHQKCNACVKKCPVGAKYFDAPDYLET
jgi:NAD-dependent dihydropyrimidine dehydrogenase PreA subunit